MTLEFDQFNTCLLKSVGKTMLDVGSGSSRYFEWAQKHGIARYHGVDIDPIVVNKAKEKFPEAAECFQVLDARSLSIFPDKSFETIILIEVIEHIPSITDLETLLIECRRVASKNILLTTPNCGDEELLRKHGLMYIHMNSNHVVGSGSGFDIKYAHRHYLRFTKKILETILASIFTKYEVKEASPIEIITIKPVNYKLWAEITITDEPVSGT